MTDTVAYSALVWAPDEDGQDYGVTFPDFPGCVSAGININEALQNAREALIFHIEGMLEDGEGIPEPSVLDQTFAEARVNCVFAMVVIPKPQKAVRFNIHASAAELVRIDKAAAKLGKPRSRFLIESALEKAEQAQYGLADQEQEPVASDD